MSNGDPAAEWRRLEELYRQMSEDELQVVADEAYQLTDVAREVLGREIAWREAGIKLAVEPEAADQGENPEPGDFAPEEYELCVMTRVWDRKEAEEVKKKFDEAGIASYLGPNFVEKIEDYNGSYDQGVEVRVRYVDRMLAINADRFAHRNDPPDTEEVRDTDYRCPKCKSDAIVFEELERESPDQPDYLSKFNWHCEACGHEWTDDGVEKEA